MAGDVAMSSTEALDELRAVAAELQASRARIVEAGDEARVMPATT